MKNKTFPTAEINIGTPDTIHHKAVKLANATLCCDCPLPVQKRCRECNNGGLSCAKLFEEYLRSGKK